MSRLASRPSPPERWPGVRALAAPASSRQMRGTISTATPNPRIVATCQSVVERRWIVKVMSSTWSATSTTWMARTRVCRLFAMNSRQCRQATIERIGRARNARIERQLAVVHDHRHDQVEHPEERGQQQQGAGGAPVRDDVERAREQQQREVERHDALGADPEQHEAAFDQVDDPLVVRPEQDDTPCPGPRSPSLRGGAARR